jgi:hypothetical protein
MDRYQNIDKWYADLAARLGDVRRKVAQSKELPTPEDLGLALPTTFSRRTRPHKIISQPLQRDAAWVEPAASHRLGLSINAGDCDRHELPIEVDVSLSDDLASKPVRAFCSTNRQAAYEILAQLDTLAGSGKSRLTLMLPGPIPAKATANLHVYLGLEDPLKPLDTAASTASCEANEMYRLENDNVRLLLGSEGAHVYRWSVIRAGGRDMTMPGTTSWFGFADLGRAYRAARNELQCVARGPALVRYVSRDTVGMVKTISLFGGTSWLEVVLIEPVDYYFDFDDPGHFAGDGPTPGEYLFANEQHGMVGKEADAVSAQVKANKVHWAIKWNETRLALGMTTPEVAGNFVIGPGAGAGGVGIEHSPPASHFVTFAGLLRHEPAETMRRLQQTLNFKNQPKVFLYGIDENSRRRDRNNVKTPLRLFGSCRRGLEIFRELHGKPVL